MGRGTRIKSNNVWVLGRQWALQYEILSFHILWDLTGTCFQPHFAVEVMEAQKDEVTWLRQYSWDEAEPGFRPVCFYHLPMPVQCQPTHQPALLPQGLRMLQNPLGLLSSLESQPSPNCSVWTPGPSAGLVQALPSLQLSLLPLISGCLPTATLHLTLEFSTHTHLHCHMLTKAAVELIPWDTPQKLGGVLGWFEQRPASQVILEPTASA